MITGFNTDIEHEGVVYHVQTEDKGLDSPLILSLVYAGGAILASKRSRYEDLIEAGFNEEVLTQRLQRQHRLICAAINAGRLEELKRMGAKARVEAADPEVEATETGIESLDTITTGEEATAPSELLEAQAATDDSLSSADVTLEESRSPQPDSQSPISPYTVHDPRRQTPQKVVQAESGVALTILNEDEFRAGETFTVRILLADNSRSKPRPLPGVPVSVKVLGTAFRPQIYSVKTERDGVAIVSIKMPKFTSGRAAVLIRTELKGETIEARRVIHPAR